MTDTIGALADEYWDAWMESSPSLATVYGDHRFDDRLEPVSRQAEAEVIARMRTISARAGELPGLGPDDALTRDILMATIDHRLLLLDSGLYSAPINPYLGVQASLAQTLSRSAAQDPEQAEMLLTRVRSIPEWLTEVEDRIRTDLAEGLTPTHTNLERVLGQIDASVAGPLEQDPMLQIGAPPDWPGEEAWRKMLRHAVEEGVRPAFARYREFLAAAAGPVARPDDKAGLLHFPDGERRYELLVRSFTGLDVPAAEIHRIGVDEVTGQLRDEFATIGTEAFGLTDPSSVIGRLRDDPDLRYSTAEEILDHARRTIDRAWEAVPPWFGQMPRNKCEVVPVPAGLAPSMPLPTTGSGHRTAVAPAGTT